MEFNIIYDQDYRRTITAVLTDNRANIPEIRNQIGIVIKQYVDAQVALVTDNVVPYKIETDLGVLVGYFLLQVTNMGQTAVNIQQVIRPVFQSFNEISGIVSNFITNGSYQFDILF